MSKHTSGLWVVEKKDYQTWFVVAKGLTEIDDIAICHAHTVLSDGDVTEKDNAEFIVKACNSHDRLLEALKAAIASWPTDGGPLGAEIAYTNALKVIAKAEGK